MKRILGALLIALFAVSTACAGTIAINTQHGARVIYGAKTPYPEGSAYPVPIAIQKAYRDGEITERDLIVVEKKVRIKRPSDDVDRYRTIVMNEIDRKTNDLILAGFTVTVGEVDYTFSMTSYSQVNLLAKSIKLVAGLDVLPTKVRLKDPLWDEEEEKWTYSVTITTANQLKTLVEAMESHVAQHEGAGWALKIQALGTTSVSTLEGIRENNVERE